MRSKGDHDVSPARRGFELNQKMNKLPFLEAIRSHPRFGWTPGTPVPPKLRSFESVDGDSAQLDQITAPEQQATYAIDQRSQMKHHAGASGVRQGNDKASTFRTYKVCWHAKVETCSVILFF